MTEQGSKWLQVRVIPTPANKRTGSGLAGLLGGRAGAGAQGSSRPGFPRERFLGPCARALTLM